MEKKYQNSSIENELRKHRKISYKTLGVSMLPLLRQGKSLVHIVNKDDCDFDISDVVLYRRGDQLVLHRIIGKDGSNYIAIGDNQYVPENISEEQIIGVMTAFLRDGKEVLREDEDYQKYVGKIMNMPTYKRKIMYYIRKLI